MFGSENKPSPKEVFRGVCRRILLSPIFKELGLLRKPAFLEDFVKTVISVDHD